MVDTTEQLVEDAIIAFNDAVKRDLPISEAETRKYLTDALQELTDHLVNGGDIPHNIRLVIVEN